MKATGSFKNIISDHLQKIANADQLFAETLKKPEKSIDSCISYIFSEVKKSGFTGFADEEIFAMAIHYFDEDDLKPGASINCKVVVNHSIKADKKNTSKKAVEAKNPAKNIAVIDKDLVNQISLF